MEDEIESIIEGIRKEVALPGFRKGKAPLELVRARFQQTARKEAIEKLIPQAYEKALAKESLRPVLPAEISDMEYGGEGPLTFRVAIELFPQVEVKRYKGISVKKDLREVTDQDVDRQIEALRERFAGFEKLDREAAADDVVVVDYWRLGADGKRIPGSKIANYPVQLGGAGVVKEFNDGLAGVRKGDTKTIEVTYPEDFGQEDLRGKTIAFGLEVKDVGRRVVPELDEEFMKMLAVDSVDDLRTKVSEQLAAAMDNEATANMKRSVLNTIVQESTFEVPEGMVKMALDSMMESYRKEYEHPDVKDGDERLAEIRQRLHPVAVNIVKEQFIIDHLAKEEKIAVEESDFDALVRSIAERSGMSPEDVRPRLADSEELDRWRRETLKNKVLDFLLENADTQK